MYIVINNNCKYCPIRKNFKQFNKLNIRELETMSVIYLCVLLTILYRNSLGSCPPRR